MGQFFLGESQSRIYPNMCAKFGCCPTVVSKGGGYRQTDIQTDRVTLQRYIVDYDMAFYLLYYLDISYVIHVSAEMAVFHTRQVQLLGCAIKLRINITDLLSTHQHHSPVI